jgi:hypothetical protein
LVLSQALVVRFLALISSLILFFLLLRSLKNWIRQTTLEEQVQHGEQILALQREQYTRLQEHIQETAGPSTTCASICG